MEISVELKLSQDLYDRIRNWTNDELGEDYSIEKAIVDILDNYIWELEDVR
jgi:hypothetical protein